VPTSTAGDSDESDRGLAANETPVYLTFIGRLNRPDVDAAQAAPTKPVGQVRYWHEADVVLKPANVCF